MFSMFYRRYGSFFVQYFGLLLFFNCDVILIFFSLYFFNNI